MSNLSIASSYFFVFLFVQSFNLQLVDASCSYYYNGTISTSVKTTVCSVQAGDSAVYSVWSPNEDKFKFSICPAADSNSVCARCLNPECTYPRTYLSSGFVFPNAGEYVFFVVNTNAFLSGLYEFNITLVPYVPDNNGCAARPTELGPFGVAQAVINKVEYLGNRRADELPLPAFNGGAVTSIAPHPTWSNWIYVGTTNGGVWRTTNRGASWRPLTDSMPSLSISHISFDSYDPSYNTLIASVAITSNFIGSGGDAAGVYLTTDGGNTWTVASSEFQSKGIQVQASYKFGTRIVSCLYSWMYPFITQPLYLSSSNGQTGTWTTAGPHTAPGYPSCTSLVHLSETTSLFAAFLATNDFPKTGEIWMSTDEGQNWASLPGLQVDLPFRIDSLRLSATVLGRSALYTIAGGYPHNDIEIRVCSPIGIDCEFVRVQGIPSVLTGGQAQFNLAVLADNEALGVVYIAGDRSEAQFQRCSINADTGTATCSGLSHDFAANNSAPHSDSRCLAFDADGNLLEGDDGGLWLRTYPRSSMGRWYSLSGDMRALECHSGDYDPISGIAACGAQDNGLSIGYQDGPWLTMLGGDGADVRLATQFSPARLYSSAQRFGYIYNCQGSSCNCDAARSAFRSFSLSQLPYSTQAQANGILFPMMQNLCMEEKGLPFYTEFEINQFSSSERMVVLGGKGIYEVEIGKTPTKLASFVRIEDTEDYGGLVVGGRTKDGTVNANVVWAAASLSGVFVRNTTGPLRSTYGWGSIAHAIAIDVDDDPTDCSAAYVLCWINLSIHVLKTTDWGASYADITGNLATAAPVSELGIDFRSLSVIYSSRGTNLLVLGGMHGLYVAEDLGTELVWTKLTSFPNVLVLETRVNTQFDLLVVSTMGRGMWRIDSVSTILSLCLNGSPSSTAEPSTTPIASISSTSSSSSVHASFSAEMETSLSASNTVSVTASASSSASVFSSISPSVSSSSSISFSVEKSLSASASPSDFSSTSASTSTSTSASLSASLSISPLGSVSAPASSSSPTPFSLVASSLVISESPTNLPFSTSSLSRYILSVVVSREHSVAVSSSSTPTVSPTISYTQTPSNTDVPDPAPQGFSFTTGYLVAGLVGIGIGAMICLAAIVFWE